MKWRGLSQFRSNDICSLPGHRVRKGPRTANRDRRGEDLKEAEREMESRAVRPDPMRGHCILDRFHDESEYRQVDTCIPNRSLATKSCARPTSNAAERSR